jgi:hypothetical protein
MLADGIWTTRRERASRAYQPRHRRACLGELVQIDGCLRHWFEGRGPQCTALVFVDDATGRLMELRFARSESTFDYFEATRTYLQRHGKPVAFYSDKHSIFRVNAKDPKAGDGYTQFGRAMGDLNIDIICANSAPAKGRVERAHQTLQETLGEAGLPVRRGVGRPTIRELAVRRIAAEAAVAASTAAATGSPVDQLIAQTVARLAMPPFRAAAHPPKKRARRSSAHRPELPRISRIAGEP